MGPSMRLRTLIAFAFIFQASVILFLWTTRSDNEEKYHEVVTVVISDKEKFEVNKRGAWEGLGATKGHVFDEKLSSALDQFFQKENVQTLLDLGAGLGNYSQAFKNNGVFVSCYDGNPNTQELSDGRCAVLDLSKLLDLTPHDWVMSLEVGEHIPMELEDNFIENLHRLNKKGLIISWAVLGQTGTAHVNCRSNDYIKDKFSKLHYTSDEEAATHLRSEAKYVWFKDTIMVFRKN